MAITISKFNWRTSKAHLFLLSKFLRPTSLERFGTTGYWKDALGESFEQAIKRFIDEGALQRADLSVQINEKFGFGELKSLLKQRGMKTSGKKDDLIKILLQVAPDEMKKLVQGGSLVNCSAEGRELAENYLAIEDSKRAKLDEQIKEYLRLRKFREASLAITTYEAQQVFSNITEYMIKNPNPNPDIAALGAIFKFKPKVLEKLTNEILEILRIAAAMNYLWGTNNNRQWLPSEFKSGLAIDNNIAVGLFVKNAYFHRSISEYRSSDVVTNVKILSTKCCTTCNELANKKFSFDAMPELPYEHCTCDTGCNCTVIPMVRGVDY